MRSDARERKLRAQSADKAPHPFDLPLIEKNLSPHVSLVQAFGESGYPIWRRRNWPPGPRSNPSTTKRSYWLQGSRGGRSSHIAALCDHRGRPWPPIMLRGMASFRIQCPALAPAPGFLPFALAGISHRSKCIWAPNQRKSFCSNDLRGEGGASPTARVEHLEFDSCFGSVGGRRGGGRGVQDRRVPRPGTLTVTGAAGTIATLGFNGSYTTSSFALASDGHGGKPNTHT